VTDAKRKKCLPPWLDQGSRDIGLLGPVSRLISWMIHNKVPGWEKLQNMNDYSVGGPLAACVRAVQMDVGLRGDDIDGNWGQGTRRAVTEDRSYMDADFDNWRLSGSCVCAWKGPNHVNYLLWDENNAVDLDSPYAEGD